MIRDGKHDCPTGKDEDFFIENCNHKNLFLCLDQSRCLPKNLLCDGYNNCIDGSDEIEGCSFVPLFMRNFDFKNPHVHNWSYLLLRYTNTSYLNKTSVEAKIETKKITQKVVFGLKCNSYEGFNIFQYQTVPQPNSLSNTTYCKNEEDKCFNESGELRCFRCFDDTIILKSQVCDGIIDCQDLSDECTCENTDVKPLCDTFYKKDVSTPNEFSIICNYEYDFPGSVDEKYCEFKLLFIIEDSHLTNSERNCSKGRTALNNSLYVPPGDTDLESEILSTWRSLPKYQPKQLSSLSNGNGSCNWDFECPYREDECSQECFKFNDWSNNDPNIYQFLSCFSFLLEDLSVFSVEADSINYFQFNNSVMQSHPYTGSSPNQTINVIDEILSKKLVKSNRKLLFNSKQKNISFVFDGKNIYKTCADNLLDCPWYFRCENNKYDLIDVAKVCDFNVDCTDQSDERYCSDRTHFNCSMGYPVSIDRKKVNDNIFDCSDRSDECKESPISSVTEMIKNPYLRKYIWVTFIGIIVFNAVVIIKNIKKIKSLDGKQKIKYYNLIFILNLSFSDIIFGFVLCVIAITSSKFSGDYCFQDFNWRTSFLCDVIGILTLISSQTSLNILVLITGFRLHSVYQPFKSLNIRKYKLFTLLFLCWLFPLVLSIIPIVLKKEFTQTMVISKNIFLTNKKKDRLVVPNELYKIAKNIENVWVASKPHSIPSDKSVYTIRNFQDWFFNSNEMRTVYPDTSIDVKTNFGFYSSSAVPQYVYLIFIQSLQ